MNISVKNIENALVLILVIMLVYVLYKRLIKILGKGEYAGIYASFVSAELNEDITKFEVEIEVPEGANNTDVKFELLDSDNKVIDQSSVKLEVGRHKHDFNIEKLIPGKYNCRMTTDNQESSRYFTK